MGPSTGVPHRALRLLPAALGLAALVLAGCGAGIGSLQGAAAAVPAAPAGNAGAPAAGAPVAATSPASPSAKSSATPSKRHAPAHHAPERRHRGATAAHPAIPTSRTTPPRQPARATAPPRPTTSPRPTTAPPRPVPASGLTADEAQVLQLVNSERGSAGCRPLASNKILVGVARAHSEDMAVHGYFDHTSPDGRSPFDRMRDAGYQGNLMGENIAAGQPTPAAVMDAWMNSPGHRANILNCGYAVIGIGVYRSDASPYRVYWTQDFGDR